MPDPKSVSHAVEVLERERLTLREHIRRVKRNEREIMAGIGHESVQAQLDDVNAALDLLTDLLPAARCLVYQGEASGEEPIREVRASAFDYLRAAIEGPDHA